MEQFRQVGEVLGSIRAIMVFRHDIRINPRQCQLLADATESAFAGIAEEMRQHLRLEERNTKWKALEHPLKELHRVFRDVEHYIRQSLEHKDWWGRALALSQSVDCVNLHLQNLLWCIPVVVEAIETVGELTGESQEEINRRRLVLSKKYEREWMESGLFQHRFGKLYLVTQDMCRRMDTAVKEDRWVLSETISEKRSSMTKQESLLAELLTSPRGKILPISTLVSSPEYQVRRRLGSSSRLKEIQWMGESFALKHVFGEVEQSMQEISLLTSLSHPNVMHYMYLFSDEDKKECLIVMELMNKDLINYIKEISCSKRKVPIPLLVAVDVMLQIAGGIEYLHSRNIYHGDLNPSNILVKTKNSTSSDGYVQVKISGLGKSAASRTTSKGPTSPGAGTNSCIWYAPEVFSEQEQPFETEVGNGKKYTEKADVYSFAMICFELLTGKVPFEDSHLQGDKMSRNIRTGERPLFPFPSPKFLTNLIKRCWHADPNQRPTFSSICRTLRYIKRFLIMNRESGQPDPPSPPLDYFDIEMTLSKKFASWQRREILQVSDIPFEMYAYRVIERERTSANIKEKSSDSSSETSISGEDNGFQATVAEDVMSLSRISSTSGSGRSSNATYNGFKNSIVRKGEVKPRGSSKQIGSYNVKVKIESSPQRLISSGGSIMLKAGSPLHRAKSVVMSPLRHRSSGHASDSEL